MKSNKADAGWWLALATVLALWSMAALAPVAPVAVSAEHGFGALQWKTA